MEQKKLNKKVKQATPQSLMEKAGTFQMDESLSIHDNVKLFTQSIRLTNSELNEIKKKPLLDKHLLQTGICKERDA